MWNDASWGHVHLPMSCILADLVRWFSRGCLWQRVKRERVQRKGSGLPVGLCGSTRVTARCCVWQPSQLPCTPGRVVLLLWQQAEEQVELGRDIAPPAGSQLRPSLLQAQGSTLGPQQSAYKRTKFSLPFFHLLLTFSINYLIRGVTRNWFVMLNTCQINNELPN